MGAGQSYLETTNYNFENVSIDDVNNLDTVLPKFTINEVNMDELQKDDIINKKDYVLEMYNKFYNRFYKDLVNNIKLNNLQFNYNSKNNIIINNLKKQITEKDLKIKNNSEVNYKNIRKTLLLLNRIREKEQNKKLLLTLNIIFLLIILIVILYKSKLYYNSL